MTDGFSGVQSASSFSQSKAEHKNHSLYYGFRDLTPLFGKSGVLSARIFIGHEYQPISL
jgi:hypothetical protein